MESVTLSPPRGRFHRFTVGDRLRKAREESGIEVQQMAQLIQRSRNSVARYERSSVVDHLVVRAYSEYTLTSVEWLLTGHEPEGDDPITIAVTRQQPRDIYVRQFPLKFAA